MNLGKISEPRIWHKIGWKLKNENSKFIVIMLRF
jgi:hypothetical protein